MSLTILNNVAETTTTTGTGSYLLAGVVSAGYRPFGDGGNGAVIPYKIENADKTKSEWGLGTYDSGGNTLARTTVLGNYLGTTAAINWTSGTKNIYSPPLKELLSWSTFNDSGDVSAIKLAESSAPSIPASGFASVYVKTDGKLYLKDDAGTETDLTAGSTLDSLSDVVITSAASGQVIRHNGTNWVNASLATAGIQPLDATLTALAGLTIAANSLTIGTGADAFSQTSFSANTFPARASTGDLVAKTITDFALTIIDDADAAAVRTTIGAGTGSGDALVANTLDQFADVTQTSGKTLAITDNTTLAGGTHSGTNTGDQNVFGTIAVSGQSDVVADATGDTLTFVAGTNVTITTDAGADSITINATSATPTVITVADTTDTTCFVGLFESATGDLAPKTDGGLTYDASSGTLTATAFSGPLTGNVTGNASGSSGSCTGNAATATALETARTINGVSFDGTGNITVTAAGSTLSDTVTVAKGGTGLTALGSALQVLRTNAGATALEFATLSGGGDMLAANNLSDVASAATSATNLGLGTGNSPQFTAVNVGHATDTTLARVSAGVLSVEGNTIYAATGTDVALADGGTGASLTDPNADRILFWDDSAGAVTWLTAGSGLTITDTTLTASGGGGAALSGITAATTSNTIANGNNTGQVWNWANTTNTTVAMTFGETTAATNGTSTSGVPNQVLAKFTTLASSTMSPLSVYSRAAHVFSVSPTAKQILAADSSSASDPVYSFASSPDSGIYMQSGDMNFCHDGTIRLRFNGPTTDVRVTPGTATVPGLSDTSQANTGIYWPASNVVGVCNATDGEWARFSSRTLQVSSGSSSLNYSLNARRSRGSVASPTVITTGDDLFQIGAFGYVGATNTYVEASRIKFDSTGAISDSSTGIGGTISFQTRNVGGALTEQLLIDNTGLSTFTTDLRCTTAGTNAASVPTLSSTSTLTNKRITPRIGTETSSATSTPTADSVDQWNVTALAVADAFAAPTGTPTDGQTLVIRIKDNGTARALTWNAIYRAGTDVPLPSTTVVSKTLYLGFKYNAADSKWDLLAVTNNI